MQDCKVYAVDSWSVPLTRSDRHVYTYINFPVLTFFTKLQLQKLHCQLCHLSATKLFSHRKRGRPEDLTPDTLKTLHEISQSCDPCQRIQDGPGLFRISFGDSTSRFNDCLVLDIVYIDGKPILQVVDESIHFSAAHFLPDVSTKTAWSTIVDFWASVYTGLPNSIRVYQGCQLRASFYHYQPCFRCRI